MLLHYIDFKLSHGDSAPHQNNCLYDVFVEILETKKSLKGKANLYLLPTVHLCPTVG